MNTPHPNPWLAIAHALSELPRGSAITLAPVEISHPVDAGLARVVAFPAVGQHEEFSLAVPSGALRVRDFGTYYEAMLLARPAIETMLQEQPGTSVLGAVVLGALIGTALGKSKEAALTGALVGGFAGLAGTAVANAETSPATARVAGGMATALPRAFTLRAPLGMRPALQGAHPDANVTLLGMPRARRRAPKT